MACILRILLLLSCTLIAEEFTYLLHSSSGELDFDPKTRTGTLTMEGVSNLVPLFTVGERRNMGYTHLNQFLKVWKGTPYAMVSYYGQDAQKNVYHAVPLQIDQVHQNGSLVFAVKVLNDQQVAPKTQMGETLLYIDNFAGADPGCLFPGAGWQTEGCHKK